MRVVRYLIVLTVLAVLLLASPAGALADNREPSDVPLQSWGPLFGGAPNYSFISSLNDEDWYYFNVLTPQHVRIELTAPAGMQSYTLGLYDSGVDTAKPFMYFSHELAKYTPYASSPQVRSINYTLQRPGTYRVRVWDGSHKFNDVDSYNLVVSGTRISRVTRLAGADRIHTAIQVSRRTFGVNKIGYAVAATAYNFPDALAGAVLARAYGAPLLLLDPTNPYKNADVKAEMERLGVTDVLILGSSNAVSDEVVNALKDSHTVVERVAGSNRFDTARKIAELVQTRRGHPQKVVVSTGRNYADALSVSAYAANKGYPIILTEPGSLSAEARAALTTIRPGEAIIAGSVNAVSASVESAIRGMGITPTRIGGTNRIETSEKLARYALNDGMSPGFPLVATGFNFPDALAGGVLGAQLNAPLLLTQPTFLSPETRQLLSETKASNYEVNVLGAEAAISGGVAQEIDSIYP